MPSLKLLVPVFLLCASACISLPDIDPSTPGADTPPTLTESTQSATAALGRDAITFHIAAQDAKSSQLRFAWTASTGTLGSPANTGLASDVIWTAPLCVPTGTQITITVTVTNDAELSASKAFTVSASTCPTPTVAAGEDYSLALRGDGTVWAWGNAPALGYQRVPMQEPTLTSVTAHCRGQDPRSGPPQ